MGSIVRRKRKPLKQPVIGRYLSTDQMDTYIRLQEMGWKIYFIRKPHSGEPTVVVNNNADTRVGVIDQNGDFTVL